MGLGTRFRALDDRVFGTPKPQPLLLRFSGAFLIAHVLGLGGAFEAVRSGSALEVVLGAAVALGGGIGLAAATKQSFHWPMRGAGPVTFAGLWLAAGALSLVFDEADRALPYVVGPLLHVAVSVAVLVAWARRRSAGDRALSL